MNTLNWIVACIICFCLPCVVMAVRYYISHIRSEKIKKKLIEKYEAATDPHERDELCYQIIRHGMMDYIARHALRTNLGLQGGTYNPQVLYMSPEERLEFENQQSQDS